MTRILIRDRVLAFRRGTPLASSLTGGEVPSLAASFSPVAGVTAIGSLKQPPRDTLLDCLWAQEARRLERSGVPLTRIAIESPRATLDRLAGDRRFQADRVRDFARAVRAWRASDRADAAMRTGLALADLHFHWHAYRRATAALARAVADWHRRCAAPGTAASTDDHD